MLESFITAILTAAGTASAAYVFHRKQMLGIRRGVMEMTVDERNAQIINDETERLFERWKQIVADKDELVKKLQGEIKDIREKYDAELHELRRKHEEDIKACNQDRLEAVMGQQAALVENLKLRVTYLEDAVKKNGPTNQST